MLVGVDSTGVGVCTLVIFGFEVVEVLDFRLSGDRLCAIIKTKIMIMIPAVKHIAAIVMPNLVFGWRRNAAPSGGNVGLAHGEGV